jgi:hypothetical protein
MTKISAWLAIVFGLSLSVLEALRNWGNWQWWPFWVVDYVAAALLIIGGALALRGRADRWLTAGWGFACAMFWMSFFGHLDTVLAGGVDTREARLTTIIGALFGVTVVGLVLSLIGRRTA